MISIDDFAKVKMTAADGKVLANGKELKTEKGPVLCEGITKGRIS